MNESLIGYILTCQEGLVSHVKENLKKFLEDHFEDEAVKSSIDSLRKVGSSHSKEASLIFMTLTLRG